MSGTKLDLRARADFLQNEYFRASDREASAIRRAEVATAARHMAAVRMNTAVRLRDIAEHQATPGPTLLDGMIETGAMA